MAVKPLLHLGDACKCIFTTVQLKPKLHATTVYKQIRHFRRFRDKERGLEISLLNKHVKKSNVPLSKMWKPFAFTIMFSGTTFVAATIWDYENQRKIYSIQEYYTQFRVQKTGWRRDMQVWWNNLTEGERIFVPICFLNVVVFLAWRVPKFQKAMMQYFSSNPTSSAICWPMLLSSFSHHSFLHLAVNMYVLHSFSSLAVSSLGKEQFTAVYLTSAVVSSFMSNLYKTAFGLCSPSLGASGAIMGVLGFTCTEFPNIYISVIFLPMYKFAASTAIKFLMGVDLLGILCRWQIFDHAAHLGGVLFGIFWQAWGYKNIWQKREPVFKVWNEICESFKAR